LGNIPVKDAPSVMAIDGEKVGSSLNVRETVSFGAGYGGASVDLLSRG